MGWGGWGSLDPVNWSVNGNSAGGVVEHGAGELYTKLGGSRAGGNQIQSDISAGIKHPISGATGGLVGGQGGISSYNKIVPGWMQKMGASTNNSLRGGLSNPTVRDSALAVAAYFGGEAAFGGSGGGAVAGGTAIDTTGDAAVTDELMASTPSATADATTYDAAGNAVNAGKGMSTAQKIALGIAGGSALFQKKQGLNPNLMAGATPAQTTSNKILDQYNSGQLNPADQYNIAKWAQDAKASKQEYYAKAGLSDSSMATQDIASIDAQAGAMRDQALQNMLQGGLNAAGVANTATGQAVNLQIQQDQQAQQAQQQFFEMLAFTMA